MANRGGLHSTINSTAAQSSSNLGWSVISGINVIMGSLSPMLVNQPDLARYCKDPRDAGFLQGVSLFVSSVLVFFLGLASTASLQAVWGTAYWNPYALLQGILTHSYTAGARAGTLCLTSCSQSAAD